MVRQERDIRSSMSAGSLVGSGRIVRVIKRRPLVAMMRLASFFALRGPQSGQAHFLQRAGMRIVPVGPQETSEPVGQGVMLVSGDWGINRSTPEKRSGAGQAASSCSPARHAES